MTAGDMDGIWQRRGLQTLFGFAVAVLLGALVCFVAHNWAYLGTGGKLGGLAALLLVATGLWVWRRFDGPTAVSLGIAAQVLIGVWLAAAGQIYQAPGGLQDLALNWALLGLPFALASRSWAHWAVWLGVIVLCAASPVGLQLYDIFGADRDLRRFSAGGVAMAAAAGVGIFRQGSDWFATLFSAASVAFLSIFGVNAIFGGLDPQGIRIAEGALSMLAMAGGSVVAYRNRRIAPAALFATGAVLLLTLLVLRPVWETGSDETLLALLSLIITGGATFGLVKIFQRIVAQGRPHKVDAADIMEEGHDAPWYMDALIALGGFLTALFGVFFLGSLIGLVGVLTNSFEVALMLTGGVIYAVSVIWRRKDPGQFLRFMLDTLILVGGASLIAGLAVMLSELDGDRISLFAIGIVMATLSILTAWLVPRDRILHVVLALGFMSSVLLMFFGLRLSETVASLACVVLFGGVGLCLGTERPGGQRRLTVAVVFLLGSIAAAVSHDFLARWGEWSAPPRLVDLAVLVAGLAWLSARLGRNRLPTALATGVLALIAVILPLGAAPSLLLLLLGYALRSRALFSVGIAAMAWFLFSAYYDLSLTLMQLSGVMALTGGLLLGLWWMTRRRLDAVVAA